MIGRRTSHTASGLIPSERFWVSGLGSALGCVWYALPDYVPSKRRRALLKAGLLAPPGLYGVWAARRSPVEFSTEGLPVTPGSRAQAMPGGQEAAQAQASEVADLLARLPSHWWLQQLGIISGVTAVLALSAIAFERSVYRIGEGLARRGVNRPHTKVALGLGVLVPLTKLVRTSLGRAVAETRAEVSSGSPRPYLGRRCIVGSPR